LEGFLSRWVDKGFYFDSHISAGFKQTFLTVNLTVKIFWAFCFRILPSEAIPGGAKAYK